VARARGGGFPPSRHSQGGDHPSSVHDGDARSRLPGSSPRGAPRPPPRLHRGVAAHGRWYSDLQMSVEPSLCSARLGGPLRIRASTCAHLLSPHGVGLLGHHQREAATAAVFPTCAVAVADAASAPVAAVAAVAAVAVVAPAVLASSASQTSAAWLARRTPGPQALPSPTGLCAGPPAGRPPDGVRTT